MNRSVIKINNNEISCSLKEMCLKHADLKNKQIFLEQFDYNDEADASKSEHFLFYESEIPFEEIPLDSKINIQSDQITSCEELNKNEATSQDVIYVTNFPRKFTDKNLLQLISSLPDKNISFTPKIERLPCVFKITFDKSKENQRWIESILCFIHKLEFSSEEMEMNATMNSLEVPVIHFLDLPPSINTIEHFIEIANGELGNFKLYEENERKDDQPLSFNVSYPDDNEAWNIIDSLNFRSFDEKEIRVNHFIDTKVLQGMSNFNIKVTNYEGEFNSYDIYEKFSQFGPIYSIYKGHPIQTMTNSNPQKDFFCIQYYVKEHAINAIYNAQNELQVNNLTLTTKESGLVVYNFKNDITENDVKKEFPDAVKIVIQKSKDRNSRPYVFINFICQEDCDKAKEKCKETYSEHLRLMCVPQTMSKEQAFLERRKEEERCQKKNTIFIQKIPENVNAEDVIQACSKFGDINSAVFIDMNTKKTRKRIAKISFKDNHGFQQAMASTITLDNIKIKPAKYLPHSH